MTVALRLDLTCQRHRTFRAQITLPAEPGRIDADWGARMQIRPAAGSAEGPFLDINNTSATPAGSELYVDEVGDLWLFLAEEDIDAIPAAADPLSDAVFRHDVVLVSVVGDVFNAVTGIFTVEPVVTTDEPSLPFLGGILDFSRPSQSGLGFHLGVF